MGEIFNLGRRQKEDVHFFLNSTEIPGIQSINENYELNSSPLNYLGVSNCRYAPRGPYKGSFNLNSLLITDDQFINLTGITGFNGYVVKDKTAVSADNFSFTSGYLNSYTQRCSVGQIPSLDIGVDVYGNIGNISRKDKNNPSSVLDADFGIMRNATSQFLLKIADPGSLSLSLDEFTNNRVLSYTLDIKVNRLATYPLGTSYPKSVDTIFPIQVNATFQIEQATYKASALRNYPQTQKIQDLTITANEIEGGQAFLNYSFKNMNFMGESYGASVDGAPTINLNYRGYYHRY